MKIGFSLLSHQAPGPMMSVLLDSLNDYPEKEIAIHHDFFQADFDETPFKNIPYQLVKNYTRTYWSHVNNIHAILETFKLLYQKNCDWYVTLSSNCYPIKSHQYITEFLNQTEFDGFIERNNVLTDHFDFYKYFRKGFSTKYLFKLPVLNLKGKFKYKVFRSNRKPTKIMLNDSFVPYHGSDWFMINKSAMEYLLANEAKINEMVSFLADVNKGPDINICPPEVVFQTILGNTNKLNFNNDNFRFIDWTNAKDWHPNILTTENWQAIKDSKALFARKFNWEQSSKLIELIDNQLLSKT